jgi:hypothetical protein
MRIRIRHPSNPGSRIRNEKNGSGIWNKHPGSATLSFIMSSSFLCLYLNYVTPVVIGFPNCRNHPSLNTCEMCEMPRILLGRSILLDCVQRRLEFLSAYKFILNILEIICTCNNFYILWALSYTVYGMYIEQPYLFISGIISRFVYYVRYRTNPIYEQNMAAVSTANPI